MSKKKPDLNSLKPETRLVVAAHEYAEHGFLNPAVYRGSTIVFDDIDAFHGAKITYGRRGSPISRAIESAISAVEGGYNTKVTPSGLSAISTMLLSYLGVGDHLLVTDAVYQPARHFCDTTLKRLGIETEYFDPLIGAGIASLIRPNTRLIYCESPGAQTMEVQDIPAIAETARKAGCLMILDNSWSGGHYFKAFDHGCDISLQSATKYLGGHSDLLLGSVTCTEKAWPQLEETYGNMGMFAGPDDMYLTLRGIRTLDVRLARHMENALKVAEWLRGGPIVDTILHPGLPGAPGHKIWKRDFVGASGLFSVVLKPCSEQALKTMLDGLQLFGKGYGWGGFESLCIPFKARRTATQWNVSGPTLRFHIGLESPDDLIDDLKQGFERFKKSS